MYHCPDCGYISEDPGDCPTCGIPLVESQGATEGADGDDNIEDEAEY